MGGIHHDLLRTHVGRFPRGLAGDRRAKHITDFLIAFSPSYSIIMLFHVPLVQLFNDTVWPHSRMNRDMIKLVFRVLAA